MSRTLSGPIIRASIFSPFPQVIFGFSTRRSAAAAVFGIGGEHLAVPKQVHGDRVVRVFKPGEFENCDALISSEKDVYLSISVADCLPIFFFDPAHDAVAVIHAGWRGCVHRIVEKTIDAMRSEFSSEPTALRVFIGPSARVCCYEVGQEVARQFDRQFLFQTMNSRAHLDMVAVVQNMMTEAGVQRKNIETSPYCTICTPQLFHSYRRDKERAGRMVGIIGIHAY